jgi:hypothetical protein
MAVSRVAVAHRRSAAPDGIDAARVQRLGATAGASAAARRA